jgi:transcription initiation factor TFIIIB Brf1 subunit/transcription initiation factor TFIIB
MLTEAHHEQCAFCLGRIVDVGEELVCSSCGVVTPKEVVESDEERRPQAIDYTNHSLGSYLGPLEYGYEEIFSRGFSDSPSNFRYLKTISDFSCKEGAGVYNCAKLIERVCEKLTLPKTVVGESVTIAKGVMSMRAGHGEITLAAISAYSIINACKRLRVTSVGVREVMDAHRNLGYRVKTSVIIQLSIDSPIRTKPRRAEEYLANVLVHLRPAVAAEADLPAGYFNALHDAARVALENVDGPGRGGHNPRALAATAVYAGEVAMATAEDRKKVISQKEIAACVGVAEYTVREQFVEIFRPRMDAIEESLRSRASPRLERTTEMPPILLQARAP